MNRLLLILLFPLLIVSCEKEEHKHNQEQKLNNLSYGSDARNKLDVYLPANRTTATPFILLIHGGGWIAGQKEDMVFFQDNLLKKGIASASMNYRYVSGTVHYPQLMEDVDLAIKYCKAHSAEWIIRNDKFLTGGVSAGAHMSLLYSYAYDPQNLVSGVISAAGPTDFTDLTWTNYVTSNPDLRPAIENLTGKSYSFPLDSAYTKVSPVFNLKNVPTLMLHGMSDIVVFYSQAERLDSALETAGYTNKKLYAIEGANHDLGMTNLQIQTNVMDEITSWIYTYGK